MKIPPEFSGSFIQYWLSKDWDIARWIEEHRMLKNIGIKEVILQYVADSKSLFTVYPTKLKGYSSNSVDMVEASLTAADCAGMNVRVGLCVNDQWWTHEVQDGEWLNHEADTNIDIASEIMFRYSGHQAFAGWYIPYEFNPLMALNPFEQSSLNQFYKKIAGALKSKSDQSIMIAPFYNARVSGPVTLALWSNIVKHTFQNTGIDIFALQDSVGVGYNTLEDLDEIYASTQEAADQIGLILYAVIETFAHTSQAFQPARQERIQEQMSRIAPYVSRFVAFSIDHYQNGKDPAQVKGYEDYYRYYRTLTQ